MVTFFSPLFFMLFLFSSALNSSIKVQLEKTKTEQQTPSSPMLPTVIIGTPFTLKVSFEGSMTNKAIDLTSITKYFTILGTSRSTNIQMINNTVQSTSTQEYEISAKTAGTFEIGPFTVDGVTSNGITLVARAGTNADQDQTTDPDDDATQVDDVAAEMHVQVHVEKKNPCAQEPLLVKRLILQKGPIRQTQIEPLTCPGASVKKLPNELHRVEIINHSNYRVTEERYLLFANKEGELLIPASRFVFNYTPSQKRMRGNDPFQSILQQFMHFSLQQAEGRSNEVHLHVSSLPEHIKQIDAVGSFTHYSIEIDKNEVEVNQPLKITLSLTGIGNFDEIASPELHIPENDSNIFATEQKMKTEIDLSLKPGTKTFSFVLQPEKSGTLNIPEQSFTFFDPTTQEVKTLKTNALSCLVKPSRLEQKQTTSAVKKDSEVTPSELPDEHDAPTMLKNYQTSQTPSLPWSIFFLLLLFPFILMYKRIYALLTRHKKGASSKELCAQLEAALKNKNYFHSNELIKKMIAKKQHLSTSHVTETLIESILSEKGALESEIQCIKKIYLQTLSRTTTDELTNEIIQKGLLIMKKFFLCALFSTLFFNSLLADKNSDISLEKLIPQIETAFEKKEYADVLALSMRAQKQLSLNELSTQIDLFKKLSATRTLLAPQKQSSYRFLLKKIDDLSRPLPLIFFQLLFLFFWTLCIYAFFHQRSTARHKIIVLVLLLCKSLALHHSYQLHEIPVGIIKAKKSMLYSGPSNTYQKIGTLTYGQECKLIQETENFYKIKTDLGTTGWAEKKAFLVV
jgi:hypothetical protein